MTLREEYEQHKKTADLFYARMGKLEESLLDFINHIEKVVKRDARSKAEILSAIEKLCFELDCAIETADNYASLLTDRILYIANYKFPNDLATYINRLPGIVTSASIQIGRIIQQRKYKHSILETRADSLISSLNDIIETPSKQIRDLELIISRIQEGVASMQARQEDMTNDELASEFNELYARYREEEKLYFDRFAQQVISPKASLSDLYNKARANEFQGLFRDILDEGKFMRDGIKRGLTETELLSVFNYKAQEDILKSMLAGKKTQGEEPYDPLIRFILNDKEREKVFKGLRACKDTGQVAAFLKRIYTEEYMGKEDLRSGDFQSAIIPLLKFDTSENAIKQAIYKQVK